MTGAAGKDFAGWCATFHQRALSEGIAPATAAALMGLHPIPEVLAKDRAQTEFTLTLRDYLERVLTPARITEGRAALARHARLFARIADRFGVEPAILAAIWGIETSYGQNRGTLRLLPALATLAHDGRRAAFFAGECLTALRLADHCGIDPARLTGSWAGASGHMQFMPSSILAHALDFDGDGRIDLWSDDPADALASAAAYLAHHGWQPGQPALTLARLPAGFDPAHTGKDHLRPLSDWRTAGLTFDHTGANQPAALLLPAGIHGPAFLWHDNARCLLRYNAADAYVLAVARLADHLAGRTPPQLVWPEADRALTLAERITLQQGLTAAGFDTGPADGRIGPNTVRALKNWQKANGLPADGHASPAILGRLLQQG